MSVYPSCRGVYNLTWVAWEVHRFPRNCKVFRRSLDQPVPLRPQPTPFWCGKRASGYFTIWKNWRNRHNVCKLLSTSGIQLTPGCGHNECCSESGGCASLFRSDEPQRCCWDVAARNLELPPQGRAQSKFPDFVVLGNLVLGGSSTVLDRRVCATFFTVRSTH